MFRNLGGIAFPVKRSNIPLGIVQQLGNIHV